MKTEKKNLTRKEISVGLAATAAACLSFRLPFPKKSDSPARVRHVKIKSAGLEEILRMILTSFVVPDTGLCYSVAPL